MQLKLEEPLDDTLFKTASNSLGPGEMSFTFKVSLTAIRTSLFCGSCRKIYNLKRTLFGSSSLSHVSVRQKTSLICERESLRELEKILYISFIPADFINLVLFRLFNLFSISICSEFFAYVILFFFAVLIKTLTK